MKKTQVYCGTGMNWVRQPVVFAACLSFLLAPRAEAVSLKRALHVETSPASTTVEVLLVPGDNDAKRAQLFTSPAGQGNGFNTGLMRLYTGDLLVITASAPNYQSTTNMVKYEDLKAKDASEKNPYLVKLTLEPLRREIAVDLVSGAGTRFYVNDKAEEPAVTLTFVRANAGAAWEPVRVRAERPMYKMAEKTITLEEVEGLPAQNGRRQIGFSLDEIERPARLWVTANETGCRVLLDDKAVTNTPGEVLMTFTRTDAGAPWSTHLLQVEKEEYEYRPAGELLGQPAYQTNLTFEAVRAMDEKLSLPDFQPVRFFQVPMSRFAVTRGEANLEVTNSISAKDPNDSLVAKLLEFGGNPRGEPLIVGRIGATLPANAQGKPGEVLVTLPVTTPRPGQARETIGSQICLLKSSGSLTPVTVGERGVYDMDPCITKDGKTVYYSSNRSGQRGIWKKTVSGPARSQVDPGNHVDVEPAAFTTSEGVTRVAFTRYSPQAAVGSPPVIVIQEEDRLSFAETQHGRSPAWSNDGTKIAFVSPENKICVMDSTGENFRVLTSGKSVDDSPIWLPGDRQVLYASALTDAEARHGTGNYDLWRVDLDGNTQQVVSNPSFDGMPAMTSEALAGEGKQGTVTFIYFLSNRGAQRTGADAWKILYFELQ